MDVLQKTLLIMGKMSEEEIINLVKSNDDIYFIMRYVSDDIKDKILSLDLV